MLAKVQFPMRECDQCPLCRTFHTLRNCKRFQSLPPDERLRVVDQHHACRNCLALNHASYLKCTSNRKCNHCAGPHHSMLHKSKKIPIIAANEPWQCGQQSIYLDMTVQVVVVHANGSKYLVRALLTPHLRNSRIARPVARKLGATWQYNAGQESCQLELRSRHKDSKIRLIANFTLEDRPYELSPPFPANPLPILLAYPDIKIADRDFHCARHIQMILAHDVYRRVMKNSVKGQNLVGLPQAYSTIFGWTFRGNCLRAD